MCHPVYEVTTKLNLRCEKLTACNAPVVSKGVALLMCVYNQWGGSLMLDYAVSSSNIQNSKFENICKRDNIFQREA